MEREKRQASSIRTLYAVKVTGLLTPPPFTVIENWQEKFRK